MASCSGVLNGDILKTCDNNQGGIKKVYFKLKTEVTTITLSSPGLTISNIAHTGDPFIEIELNKNTSNWTEVTTVDQVNGTEICNQTLTVVIPRRSKTKRDKLILMGRFRELVAIVKDQNDVYWYLGETNGLVLSEKNFESGTAKTDRNGWTLTFVGEEPEEANEVDSAEVTDVID